MSMVRKLVTLVIVAGVAAGCGSDDPASPIATFGPPGTLTMVAGANSVRLAWGASAFEPSGEFAGYNVYLDVAPIAANDDPVFLAARAVNATPVRAISYTVSSTPTGASLQQGTRYYLHVRTVRSDGSLSVATNEVDTSPRPEGTNGTDPAAAMYDYDADTTTKSGYGWNVVTGQGVPHATVPANAGGIDVLMVEEPNSPDDGSLWVSPAASNLTLGWPSRRTTLFRDLGAGAAAWESAIAPSPATMSANVKIQADHTYAILTADQHWIKVRIVDLSKNASVPRTGGGTVNLNSARFQFAVQLIADYGRFKPSP